MCRGPDDVFAACKQSSTSRPVHCGLVYFHIELRRWIIPTAGKSVVVIVDREVAGWRPSRERTELCLGIPNLKTVH